MGRDEVLAQVRQDVEAAQEPDWKARAEAAEAERDQFREQARLMGEQQAEWLCQPCQAIHPWRHGQQFTARCPTCGSLMLPTSAGTRALQAARDRTEAAEAKLAAIGHLCQDPARAVGTAMGGRYIPSDRVAAEVLAIISTEEEADHA